MWEVVSMRYTTVINNDQVDHATPAEVYERLANAFAATDGGEGVVEWRIIDHKKRRQTKKEKTNAVMFEALIEDSDVIGLYLDAFGEDIGK